MSSNRRAFVRQHKAIDLLAVGGLVFDECDDRSSTSSCHAPIKVKDIDEKEKNREMFGYYRPSGQTHTGSSENKKCSDESGEALVVGGNHGR